MTDTTAPETGLVRASAGWIQSAREAYGLTLDQFADMLGVNPRTVRAWESGRDPIPYRVPDEIRSKLIDPTRRLQDELVGTASLPGLIAYRDDTAFHEAVPDAPSFVGARWWRALIWQVHTVTGIPIVDEP